MIGLRWLVMAGVSAAVACGSATEVPPSAASESESGTTTATTTPSTSVGSESATSEGTTSTASSTATTTTSASTTDATTGDTEWATTDATSGSTGGLPASCSNRALDGDETDVDCGGSCPGCDFGQVCDGNDDCATNSCSGGSTCGLPQPRVWLDGRDGSTLYTNNGCTQNNPSLGESIECWRNKGSAGGRLRETNGNTGVYDGGGGLELTGDTYFRDGLFGGSPANVTVFVVMRELNTGEAYAFNLNYPNTGGDDRYTAQIPNDDQNRRVIWEPGGDQNRVESTMNVFPAETQHITVLQNSDFAGQRAIFVDGIEVGQQAGAVMAAASGVSIGNGGDMYFREMRVYTAPIPPLARERIEGELACRWNLRDLLPAGHAFYAADGFSDVGCP